MIFKMDYDTYQRHKIWVSAASYRAELMVQPVRAAAGTLEIKDVVQAMYTAGKALALIPITVPCKVSSLVAGLHLQRQIIGMVRWQLKSASDAGDANSTGDFVTAVKKTSTLLLKRGNLSARFGDCKRTAAIIFPQDSRFPGAFSAFLETMATAAPYDENAVGAFVDAMGHCRKHA